MIYLFDVSLIGFYNSSDVLNIFFCLFDFSIVLLDSIDQTLSGFREWKIHLISLKLKIFFTLEQSSPLLLQMLGSLLEVVLLESSFRRDQPLRSLLQHVPVVVDLALQVLVLVLQLFILVSLLRVELLESAFIGEVNFLDLALNARNLILQISLLGKHIVKVSSLLVVLVLNVHEKGFDVFRLGVRPVLIKSQIVVS